jgi:hypothetical protein
MGSHLHPAELLIQQWREAEVGAAAAEKVLCDQAKAHLSGDAASPTVLQRTTAELLRASADRLLIEAMRKVGDVQEAAVDPERAAEQLALNAAKP